MRKILSLMMVVSLLMLALPGITAGQDAGSSEIPYNNVLYLHPISLIISTAVDFFPLMVYLTYERALKPQVALVVTPAMMMWNLEDGDDKFTATGFGAGVGVRRYLGKPVSGIYLQAKVNADYSTVKLELLDETAEASGIGISALGHVGVKGHWGKICMLLDFGIGYQYIGWELDEETSISLSGTGLAWDVNFGLGYGF